MQRDDLHNRSLAVDSVVRGYRTADFEYRVQPFDALYVKFESLTEDEFDVFGQSQTNVGAGGGQAFIINGEMVDESGEINFPAAGKVKVAGMTVFQIQDTLQSIASASLTNPVVKVRLVNFRFTVLGEVTQEGTISTLNLRTTLPEAIGLAGGLGELADRSKIKIMRRTGDETTVAYVDLLDERLVESPYYYVTQNDVIIVPPLRQRPFRKYFAQNASIIAQNIGLVLSTTSIILLIINLNEK